MSLVMTRNCRNPEMFSNKHLLKFRGSIFWLDPSYGEYPTQTTVQTQNRICTHLSIAAWFII